jgi:hypothetical protein
MIIEFAGIDNELTYDLASIVTDSLHEQSIGVQMLDFAQGYSINESEHQGDLIEMADTFIANELAPTLRQTNYSAIVVNYVTQLAAEADNITATNIVRRLFHPLFHSDLMIVVDRDPVKVYENMCENCRANTGLDQLNEQRRKLLKMAAEFPHALVLSVESGDRTYDIADVIESWILDTAPSAA